MTTTFRSEFERGDVVIIDDDRNYRVTVVGHLFRSTGAELEVSWFANGDLKTAWVPEWRLTAGEK